MFKVTNKGTRMMSTEIFCMSNLKFFNTDFDNVLVCWSLHLLPFCWKIPSF